LLHLSGWARGPPVASPTAAHQGAKWLVDIEAWLERSLKSDCAAPPLSLHLRLLMMAPLCVSSLARYSSVVLRQGLAFLRKVTQVLGSGELSPRAFDDPCAEGLAVARPSPHFGGPLWVADPAVTRSVGSGLSAWALETVEIAFSWLAMIGSLVLTVAYVARDGSPPRSHPLGLASDGIDLDLGSSDWFLEGTAQLAAGVHRIFSSSFYLWTYQRISRAQGHSTTLTMAAHHGFRSLKLVLMDGRFAAACYLWTYQCISRTQRRSTTLAAHHGAALFVTYSHGSSSWPSLAQTCVDGWPFSCDFLLVDVSAQFAHAGAQYDLDHGSSSWLSLAHTCGDGWPFCCGLLLVDVSVASRRASTQPARLRPTVQRTRPTASWRPSALLARSRPTFLRTSPTVFVAGFNTACSRIRAHRMLSGRSFALSNLCADRSSSPIV
jgi:hypothetical protein